MRMVSFHTGTALDDAFLESGTFQGCRGTWDLGRIAAERRWGDVEAPKSTGFRAGRWQPHSQQALRSITEAATNNVRLLPITLLQTTGDGLAI